MRRPSRNNTVFTAPSARVVRQFIQQRDHRLLGRHRDIEPIEPHALGGGQQISEAFHAKAQALQVDQPIDAAQSLLVGLPLVH